MTSVGGTSPFADIQYVRFVRNNPFVFSLLSSASEAAEGNHLSMVLLAFFFFVGSSAVSSLFWFRSAAWVAWRELFLWPRNAPAFSFFILSCSGEESRDAKITYAIMVKVEIKELNGVTRKKQKEEGRMRGLPLFPPSLYYR